jgi:hypothetical protein
MAEFYTRIINTYSGDIYNFTCAYDADFISLHQYAYSYGNITTALQENVSSLNSITSYNSDMIDYFSGRDVIIGEAYTCAYNAYLNCEALRIEHVNFAEGARKRDEDHDKAIAYNKKWLEDLNTYVFYAYSYSLNFTYDTYEYLCATYAYSLQYTTDTYNAINSYVADAYSYSLKFTYNAYNDINYYVNNAYAYSLQYTTDTYNAINSYVNSAYAYSLQYTTDTYNAINSYVNSAYAYSLQYTDDTHTDLISVIDLLKADIKAQNDIYNTTLSAYETNISANTALIEELFEENESTSYVLNVLNNNIIRNSSQIEVLSENISDNFGDGLNEELNNTSIVLNALNNNIIYTQSQIDYILNVKLADYLPAAIYNAFNDYVKNEFASIRKEISDLKYYLKYLHEEE